MSFWAFGGAYVASGVALCTAVGLEIRRGRERKLDFERTLLAQARCVVVVSWPNPSVENASDSTIRDVRCLGGDRYVTKNGRYIDWHNERENVMGIMPSLALLRPGQRHIWRDGEWSLYDQAGILYAPSSHLTLDDDDHAVAAKIEWTDSHGNIWARTGDADPVRVARHDSRPTYAATTTAGQ